MSAIVQSDNDKKGVLRQTAAEVSLEDITSPKIAKVIAGMKEAVQEQDDAVAIAAPQIGVPLRIFLVAERVFSYLGKENAADRVFINPRLTKLSQKKVESDEGCLSVRPLYGHVLRAEKATVKAYDEHAKPFTFGASGLLAQILQHENDHLDGILFTDKATEVWEQRSTKGDEHKQM